MQTFYVALTLRPSQEGGRQPANAPQARANPGQPQSRRGPVGVGAGPWVAAAPLGTHIEVIPIMILVILLSSFAEPACRP